MSKKYYQINQFIQAPTLRVIDAKAEQLGVLTKEAALDMARQKGLDLVLVSPGANPPVAKLINFANFKYQQQKKDKAGRSRTKAGELKEVRLTPFIAENDLNNRIKKIREFLEDGDRVKINVKFVGRQITRKEFGEDIAKEVIERLKDVALVDSEPKFQGKVLSATLKPIGKQKKKEDIKPEE